MSLQVVYSHIEFIGVYQVGSSVMTNKQYIEYYFSMMIIVIREMLPLGTAR